MALAWSGAAAAQIQPLNPLNPQQPQQGQQPQQNPGGVNQAGMPNRNLPGSFLSPQGPFSNGYNQGPDEFTSIWSAPSTPQWTGFPAFPARLQGYGNYPIPVDPNDQAGAGRGAGAQRLAFLGPVAGPEAAAVLARGRPVDRAVRSRLVTAVGR